MANFDESGHPALVRCMIAMRHEVTAAHCTYVSVAHWRTVGIFTSKTKSLRCGHSGHSYSKKRGRKMPQRHETEWWL
jgi:hypothetical protein